jgi:cell division septum initiation protein DivIVA
MKNHEDNRRPEEIEQDIEQTRAQLNSNIDAIQSKLTPGQMMDQAIGYARNSLPADFGSNLNTAIRENPIPVTLIGLGVGWLMMSGKQRPGYLAKRSQSRSHYIDDPYRPGSGFAGEHGIEYGGQGELDDHGVGGHITGDHDSAMHRASSRTSETSQHMKSRASETSEHLKHRASETGSNLKNKASSATQSIKEKMSSTGQSLKEKASSLTSRFSSDSGSSSGPSMGERSRGMAQNARSRAGELSQRSQQQYYRAKDNLTHMAEEQPLMLGALGLAVGALLGAMVPPTRREDELMGETRDKLLERGKEMARQRAEAAKSSAQRVAETAKSSAQQVAETAKQEAQRVASGETQQGSDGQSSYQKEGGSSADGAGRAAQSLH